jgi:hypothetical protein
MKKLLKDISSMKQHAGHVTRTQLEANRLQDEISNLETELLATGSTKTADDVQAELDALASDMYVFQLSLFQLVLLNDPMFSDARTKERNKLLRPNESGKVMRKGHMKTTCTNCNCEKAPSPIKSAKRILLKPALKR